MKYRIDIDRKSDEIRYPWCNDEHWLWQKIFFKGDYDELSSEEIRGKEAFVMKRFLRTTAGKAITYIICILCFCVLAISVAGAVIMAKSQMYFSSEEKLEQELIDSQIREKAWDLVQRNVYYTVEEQTAELEQAADPEQTAETKDAIVPAEPDKKESELELKQTAETKEAAIPAEPDIKGMESETDPKQYAEPEDTAGKEEQSEPKYVMKFEYGTVVPDQGNMYFRITDSEGREITVSEHAGEVEEWDYSYPCVWIQDVNGFSYFGIEDQYPFTVTEVWTSEGNIRARTADQSYRATDEVRVILQVSLKEGLPEVDSFRVLTRLLHFVYNLRYAIYVIGGLALILMVVCFIILMCVSARRPGTEELHPGPLNAVPFDLMLAASIAGGALLAYLCSHSRFGVYIGGISIIELLIILVLTVYMIIVLGLCMSLAARIKQKKLFRNTVIFHILKGLWIAVKAIWRGIGSLPLIWRTALAVLGVVVIDWILMGIAGSRLREYFFFNLAEKIVLIPIILYAAWSMRRLQKSGEALAKGDLTYHTDTRGLFWDFRKHGENLNRIADGMKAAVDESLKSERMKTELITNVSHDIKTPLTSIINYADLIGKEPCENEKIREYAEVLERQSERLKRLIEDLVEASKASTGNLDVELVPCSANLLLSQAAGEYQEKLFVSQLELIVSQPEQEMRIMADGRRMWRIFDNLMNNVCKYALPGTRVYLSLEKDGENAVFTFRNTSKDPLNISEEELMERFTRGDSSRHTEGNGLGLSIAKSLAQLQNGELRIFIDGDLFKAQLQFPCI